MAAEVELGVGEHCGGVVVVGGGPLEIEEDQLGADRRRAFLGSGHRGAPGGVVGRGREREHRVVAGPRHEVLEVGERVHRRREVGGVELADSSPQRGEAVGERVGLVEQIRRRGPSGRIVSMSHATSAAVRSAVVSASIVVMSESLPWTTADRDSSVAESAWRERSDQRAAMSLDRSRRLIV